MASFKAAQFKKIAKELYKKNLELLNVNQELTILTKLYEITTTALKSEDLSQKFIDVIIKDLSFLSGAVFIKDPNSDFLRTIAATRSKVNLLAEKIIGSPLTQLEIPLKDEKSVVVKAFRLKRKQVTHSIYDIFRPAVTEEQGEEIKEKSLVKSTLVYPIAFGDRALGAFMVSIDRYDKDLSQFEIRTLERIVTVFGVAIDRLMLYLSLQKANFRLKELDKQKDEFISMAAHELRSPATAIKGYVSMILQGDVGDVSPKAREYLANVGAINDRLIRLVNNMLNVTRIEEGRLVYQMEEVDLAKIAQEVFSSFRFESDIKGLEYTLKIPNGIKDTVFADPDRLNEIIGNIVSNAVKFTDSGSVSIKLSNPKKDDVRVEVIDTGPGITKEEQKELFQKFYRSESTEGKTMGTGLGLYITKLLIEKFKGRVGLESEFGKGSTFWVELPLMNEEQPS